MELFLFVLILVTIQMSAVYNHDAQDEFCG